MAGTVGEGATAGSYTVDLKQRQPSGEISGAAELEIAIRADWPQARVRSCRQ